MLQGGEPKPVPSRPRRQVRVPQNGRSPVSCLGCLGGPPRAELVFNKAPECPLTPWPARHRHGQRLSEEVTSSWARRGSGGARLWVLQPGPQHGARSMHPTGPQSRGLALPLTVGTGGALF